MFRSRCLVVPKNPDTGFAHQADSEIIRWKFQAKDDSFIPLTINCWPTENGRGGCDVNIEYELQDTSLELENVSIIIPLAPGSGTPVITGGFMLNFLLDKDYKQDVPKFHTETKDVMINWD